MAQAGKPPQPPQQLYRQVLDAAGSSETSRLYRFAGDCREAALAPAAAELKQALSGLPGRMQRHLFASFIELYQNVHRYGARITDDEDACPYGEIDICRAPDGGAHIHAVNLIPAAARGQLEAMLSELQQLDRDSLAGRYRDQLDRPCVKDAPSGAAGLGLIELAKRSQSELSFSFLSVHESCYLFTISLNFKNI